MAAALALKEALKKEWAQSDVAGSSSRRRGGDAGSSRPPKGRGTGRNPREEGEKGGGLREKASLALSVSPGRSPGGGGFTTAR